MNYYGLGSYKSPYSLLSLTDFAIVINLLSKLRASQNFLYKIGFLHSIGVVFYVDCVSCK